MLTNQDSDVDIQLRLRYSQSLKPCELQKLIPNHQSSFCWICLPLLTLLTPDSHDTLITGHHWDSTSLVWIIFQWQVFQGGLGREGIHRTSTGHWGSSGVGSWTPPLLHIHYITGSHHTCTWFLIPLLCWWHTALSLISTRWSNGSCTDLRLPGRHLIVDERTSSTAQPGKDWASCLPCHSNSTAWFYHPAKFFYNYPIKFSQKSWCTFRWPADFHRPHYKDCSILQVASQTSERSGPSLHRACSHNFLSRPLSFLDWTTEMLSGLDSPSTHNQTSTNDSECSGTTGLQRAQKSPCHSSLYVPCTGSWLQLASSSRHWCLHIKQPQAQHPPTSTHNLHPLKKPEICERAFASWYHDREAQNPSPERFHSPFLTGGINSPPPIRNTNPWPFSSDTWKLISSIITWLHLIFFLKYPSLSFLNFVLFPLTSHCLARICFEQCLDICITSTSCVCLPLYNVSLIVFLNCKSLWIKASAKWINVNVTGRCFL